MPPTPRPSVDMGYGRLYVRAPRAVADLPGAAWNERRRTYELSLTLDTLRELRRILNVNKPTFASYCSRPVLAWARAAGAEEAEVKALHERLATGWRLALPWAGGLAPFAHQEVMATVAATLPGAAFLCGTGTGKTRSALEVAQYRAARGDVDVVLVVCPNRVTGTWVRETGRWAPGLRAERLEGSVKARAERLRQLTPRTDRTAPGLLLVVNYEVLAKLQPDLTAMMRRGVKLGLVLDEAHKIKNPSAGVTEAAIKLAIDAPWRLVMTATPITNLATDLWSQWYVVDHGLELGANFVQFRREFFTENPFTYELKPKDGALDALHARIHKRGLRYRIEDCADLPPKTYERIEVEMAPDQRAAYRQMEAAMVATFEDHPADSDDADPDGAKVASASIVLTQMLRLAQITSGFVTTEDGTIHRFARNPKLEACVEMVRDLVRENRSVIVWAWYREDIKMLTEALAEFRPAVISGGVSVRDSDEAERRFQAGETRVMVGQQGAGGAGITLTAASAAIFYSQTWQAEARIQSEGRCYRIGSECHRNITYFDLIAPGTIDDTIQAATREKRSAADLVVELRRRMEEHRND